MSDVALAPGQTLTVTPKGGWRTTARFWHLVVALIGTASFFVSCYLAMTNAGNGGAGNGLIFSLSYFTVWSNILVAICNWLLFANPSRDGRIFRWFRMTTLVMIVITGLVYALVLAANAHPVGLGVYTNIGYHYIVPWATLLGFLLFGPRPRFSLRHVFEMLIIPVIWLIYTLIRGLFLLNPPASPPETVLGQPQHWYPYPFIDVNDPTPLVPGLKGPGYEGVAYNIVVIVILGLAFAFLFLGIDRWFSGGRKPTPLGSRAQEQVAAEQPVAVAPAASAAAAASPVAPGAVTEVEPDPGAPPVAPEPAARSSEAPSESEHWSTAEADRASAAGMPADDAGEVPPEAADSGTSEGDEPKTGTDPKAPPGQ